MDFLFDCSYESNLESDQEYNNHNIVRYSTNQIADILYFSDKQKYV